ncbi:MAG TPA: dihydropyrimidinase, partial [Gemmatimonadetes bacterium]|nr:dihydropyrimidinase [Gemmatimonadota bacterium]
VSAAVLHSDIDYSPYDGMKLNGFPTWTISRGQVIIDEGDFSAERGRGRLVERVPINRPSLP